MNTKYFNHFFNILIKLNMTNENTCTHFCLMIIKIKSLIIMIIIKINMLLNL